MDETREQSSNQNQAQNVEINPLSLEDVMFAESNYESILESSIFSLTMSAPFWGGMLQNIDIYPSYAINTLGVGYDVSGAKYVMYVNPLYFCVLLNKKQRIAVLLHELHHLVHGHLKRFNFKNLNQEEAMLRNVAADLAINQLILDLPDGCDYCRDKPLDFKCPNNKCPGSAMQLKMFSYEGKPFPKNLTADQYYDLLKKLPRQQSQSNNFDHNNQSSSSSSSNKKDKQSSSGQEKDTESSLDKNRSKQEKIDSINNRNKSKMSSIDDHDVSKAAKEQNKEIDNVDEQMSDSLNDLIKRTMIKSNIGYDNLPSSVKEVFEKIQTEKASINFKKILLQAIKRNASGVDDVHDWSRLSRRYDSLAPGIRDGELPKLHIYVDTSGSISVQELSEFLDIIDGFIKVGHRRCYISFFHTSVYKTIKYTRGQRFNKHDIEYGGTDLKDVMIDIIKKQPDLSIILTDGDYSSVSKSDLKLRHGQKIPEILFIISRSSTVKPEDNPLSSYGKTIKIPKEKK